MRAVRELRLWLGQKLIGMAMSVLPNPEVYELAAFVADSWIGRDGRAHAGEAEVHFQFDCDLSAFKRALANNERGVHDVLRQAVERIAADGSRGAAFLLAAGLLCGAAPLHAQEPGATVEVLAGAGVSLSDESAVVPVATVTVDAPVYLGDESVARVRAALRLHGSPGQTLDLRDVRTFQGAELDLQLERRIGAGESSATYAVMGGGFATRRDARGEGPRQRFPLWYYAGLAVEHREDGQPPARRLLVGLGSSQVTHPESLVPRDLVVQGSIKLASVGPASFALQGDVARPLWGSGRGVFRIAVLAGWGG